mmetsp:Transcript_26297/g.47689  ORF Transcript_26297/g.47689 Transcript_26297/m.47689 type:complete len:102 (+) Transcript_26297:876-1181(+)
MSIGRPKRSWLSVTVIGSRGSITVQTVNTMIFNESNVIIGFITSRAVNLSRLNLAALRIICFIRHVLVNSALKVSENPTANSQGNAMQVISENSIVRGILS